MEYGLMKFSLILLLLLYFIPLSEKIYFTEKIFNTNILILKTILFISQNMFQSIHTSSSSVAKSIIKTVNILNSHLLNMLQY